jgi:broad specificity phosphatase PhoE
MPRRVLLVRHGEVHARWRGYCYGQTDVGLSPRGLAQSRRLALTLDAEPWSAVHSSRLRRALRLATALARRRGLDPVIEPALEERLFGTWEGRRWDDIYADTGRAMDGLIDDPRGFSPPGGETTWHLAERVAAWYERLPANGVIVAVTHGGPIAALRGVLYGLPVQDWPDLIPACGEVVDLA